MAKVRQKKIFLMFFYKISILFCKILEKASKNLEDKKIDLERSEADKNRFFSNIF